MRSTLLLKCQAARSLANYIAAVSEGRIMVVVMQGDGAALLTEDAVVAFRAIGGNLDPRGQAGWKHTIIGVKGAGPGGAMELGGSEPGDGWLCVAPDRRTLSIAADWIFWEAVSP